MHALALVMLSVAVTLVSAETMPAPFTRVLRSGDTGKDVEMLQILLRSQSPPPVINSDFDGATENAVKQFQKSGAFPSFRLSVLKGEERTTKDDSLLLFLCSPLLALFGSSSRRVQNHRTTERERERERER
jgi:hypothetical protein